MTLSISFVLSPVRTAETVCLCLSASVCPSLSISLSLSFFLPLLEEITHDLLVHGKQESYLCAIIMAHYLLFWERFSLSYPCWPSFVLYPTQALKLGSSQISFLRSTLVLTVNLYHGGPAGDSSPHFHIHRSLEIEAIYSMMCFFAPFLKGSYWYVL